MSEQQGHPEELQIIIGKMKAANEPQFNIDAVIESYYRSKPELGSDTLAVAGQVEPEPTVAVVQEGKTEDSSIDYVTAALEKHRDYNATEDQKAEARARAEEQVGGMYDPNSFNESSVLNGLKEKEEEGFSIGGLWDDLTNKLTLTPENIAKNNEAKRIVSENRKEANQSKAEAIRSLLAKHNKGLPSDQRLRETGDNGEFTNEYYNWQMVYLKKRLFRVK